MGLHAKVGIQLRDEVCLLRRHDQGSIFVANARHEARFSDVQMLEIMCSEGPPPPRSVDLSGQGLSKEGTR